MEKNKRALDHIRGLVEKLNKSVQNDITLEDIAYVSFTYRFRLKIANESQVILFERSIIDDLEVAIDKYQGTEYFAGLDSSVKFTIYISLGQLGLLGNFSISEELINDKRQWIKAYRIDTNFNEEMTAVLYEGLKDILSSLNSQLEEHKRMKIESNEIEENIKWVESLIKYYDKNKHLNSAGAEIKNLQFLKAAAVNQIFGLEKLRSQENRPTTWRALNSKVYDIVKELRKSPFLDVQLPSFIYDISAVRRG